jgi:nucleoside-diphosphate-sugar epimerase
VITVLGAAGYVGSHLVRHLESSGVAFRAPARNDPLADRDLGHVIFCIGMTADYRQRPYDTVEAHVCKLLELVRHSSFESLLYLSSTRLYIRNTGTAREEDAVNVRPTELEDIFNITKAAGEAITLSLGNRGRVARLSNVYGPAQSGTFVSMVLEEAMNHGTIALRSRLDVPRDYISVHDTVALLVKIALYGRQRMYNVASGESVTNGELTAAISRLTGCTVTVAPDVPAATFPAIDNSRVRNEFAFRAARLLDDLPSLVGRPSC